MFRFPSSPIMGRTISRLILTAGVLVVVLLTSACSEESPAAPAVADDSGTATAAEEPFPRTVAGVTVPEPPQRIVSASASHTEILYAIGAGDQISVTDFFSNYPAAAAASEKIDAFNIGVESVVELDPDLVVLAFDPGDVVDGLASVGVPALLFAAPGSLDEMYEQITILGSVTGHDEEAAALVASLSKEIDQLAAEVDTGGDAPTYYHELDPTLFTVTSETFVGRLYELAGFVNIADEADDAGFGYPQLSAEYLIAADPDFIFLADTICCAESAASLANRPGWDQLTAVREARVVELDDDVASRWGPRVVDFLEVIVQAASSP